MTPLHRGSHDRRLRPTTDTLEKRELLSADLPAAEIATLKTLISGQFARELSASHDPLEELALEIAQHRGSPLALAGSAAPLAADLTTVQADADATARPFADLTKTQTLLTSAKALVAGYAALGGTQGSAVGSIVSHDALASFSTSIDAALATLHAFTRDADAAKSAMDAAAAALALAKKAQPPLELDVTAKTKDRDGKQLALQTALSALSSAQKNLDALTVTLSGLKATVATLQAQIAAAQTAYNNALNAYNAAVAKTRTDKSAAATKAVADTQRAMTAAQTTLQTITKANQPSIDDTKALIVALPAAVTGTRDNAKTAADLAQKAKDASQVLLDAATKVRDAGLALIAADQKALDAATVAYPKAQASDAKRIADGMREARQLSANASATADSLGAALLTQEHILEVDATTAVADLRSAETQEVDQLTATATAVMGMPEGKLPPLTPPDQAVAYARLHEGALRQSLTDITQLLGTLPAAEKAADFSESLAREKTLEGNLTTTQKALADLFALEAATPEINPNLSLPQTLTMAQGAGESLLTLQASETKLLQRIAVLTRLSAGFSTADQADAQSQLTQLKRLLSSVRSLETDATTVLQKTGTSVDATGSPSAPAIVNALTLEQQSVDATLRLQGLPDLTGAIDALLSQSNVTAGLQIPNEARGAISNTVTFPTSLLGGRVTLTGMGAGGKSAASVWANATTLPDGAANPHADAVSVAGGIAALDLAKSGSMVTGVSGTVVPDVYPFPQTPELLAASQKIAFDATNNAVQSGAILTFPGIGRVKVEVTNVKDLWIDETIGRGFLAHELNAHQTLTLTLLDGEKWVKSLQIWGRSANSFREPVDISTVSDAGGFGISQAFTGMKDVPVEKSVRQIILHVGQEAGQYALGGMTINPLKQVIAPNDAVPQDLSVAGYRGERQVVSGTIDAQGHFQLSDAGGLTSVVLSGGRGNFSLTNVQVQGTQGTDQILADPVNAGTNGTVARLSSAALASGNWAQTWPPPYNPDRGPLQGHWSTIAGWIVDTSATGYTRITIEGAGAAFQGLNYISPSLQSTPYPTSGYEVHGNVVIVYPSVNRPALFLNFQGDRYTSTNGAARADVLPPAQAALETTPSGRYTINHSLGWRGPIYEYPSNASIPGSFVGEFDIANTGLSGITLAQIDVHVGVTNTAADAVTYTLKGPQTLSPGAHTGFSVPITEQDGASKFWSITALTSEGKTINLSSGIFRVWQGNTNIKDVDPRRLNNVITKILSTKDLSPDGRKQLKDILAETPGGPTWQQLVGAVTSATTGPTGRLKIAMTIMDNQALRRALVAKYRRAGADEAGAQQQAEYEQTMLSLNPALMAEKIGMTDFDGTPAAVASLVAKVTERAVAEASTTSATGDLASITDSVFAPLDGMQNIGGSSDASSVDIAKQLLWDDNAARQALALYRPSDPVPALSQIAVSRLRTTAVGRLILGFIQKSVQITNDDQLNYLARMIEVTTGIRSEKAITFLRAAQTAADRPILLEQLFTAYPTFKAAFADPSICGTSVVTSVTTSLPDKGTVRVRFNFSDADFSYDTGNVYLCNAQGEQLSATPLISGDFRHRFYADIPLDRIASVLKDAYHGTPIGAIDLRFKVALREKAGDAKGMGGNNLSTSPLKLDLSHHFSDLSTLPAGPDHDRENVILTQLKNHFFLDNPSNFTWLIGSSAHHNSADNAVDLSDGSEGAVIRAPADATVVHNAADSSGNSTVVLESTVSIDGKTYYWYSKFLHMQANDKGQVVVNKADGSTTVLAEGSTVEAGQAIGQEGNVGKYSTGPHIHEETFYSPDGKKLTDYFATLGIDMRNLLINKEEGLGITSVTALSVLLNDDGKTFSSNGSSMHVQWDTNLNHWVSKDGGFVYDRSQLSSDIPGDSSFWLANEGNDVSQMKRVKWDVKDGAWFQWDSSTNDWVISNGKKLKWNTTSHKFE